MTAPSERFLRASRWLLVGGLLAAWAGSSECARPESARAHRFLAAELHGGVCRNRSAVARAQGIFSRLVRARRSPPGCGTTPACILENGHGIPADRDPDGWVVVSQRVLDFCYRRRNAATTAGFVLATKIVPPHGNDFCT